MGMIVAMDNESVGYFKENGDTIAKFGLTYPRFYADTTMDRTPYDPRVIYDRYANRFIAYNSYRSQDYKDSRVLVSFSKPLVGDTVEWYTYQVHCDSIYQGQEERMYWFDFPSIAVSESQLIVSVTIARRDTVSNTNTVTTNVVMQFLKADGYAGLPTVRRRLWKDVTNTDGVKDLEIAAAIDALQSPGYDTTVYLLSNYDGNSTKFFWYELLGGPLNPNAQLVCHETATSFYYSAPAYASQLGGNGGDRIAINGCDVQACLYQNGKLHFVMIRSDNGWAQLVHGRIDLQSNGFQASTWGGNGTGYNCLHPSIASVGVDTVEESFLIGFLRTGPNMLPEVCVIGHDSIWSGTATVVKAGQGLIDLRMDVQSPWDSLERWGDYTAIQRRYGDPNRRCWMVGAYPFGAVPNHFGMVDGVNGWIAEVGDSLAVLGVGVQASLGSVTVYPNPVHRGERLRVLLPCKESARMCVSDAQGRLCMTAKVQDGCGELQFTANGIYFVKVESKRYVYETQRIVVLD
ncbi:MAG: T9SS type A sorting domain-containing protein [Bacteroidia bacterium]